MKFLFFVMLLFPLLAAAETFSVTGSGPSIFFGNGGAPEGFDYRGWSENRALYRYGFDAARWDAAAPVPAKARALSRSEAERLLVRYQKIGGFEAVRDLRVLRAIIDSSVGREHPRLVAGALQNVLLESPAHYDGLIAEFPRLRQLTVANGENPFRTRAEETLVVKACVAYVHAQLKRLLPDSDPLAGTRLSDWTNLQPLSSALNQLNDAERGWRQDDMMESMVFRAVERELKGVFPSIVAKFAEQVVAPLFGDESEQLTNLEIVRHNDRVTPFIFGTHPIKGLAEEKNEYGFYSARMKDIPVGKNMENLTEQFSWTHGERKFTAQVELKLVKGKPKGPIIPSEPSPRYEELWRPLKPGDPPTLTGLIVFGSNLADDAPGVVRSYLAYFKRQGFTVSASRTEISDTKGFLRDQIVTGETAWFEKEAHSDGDDANIFEVNRKADVITLRLNRADGKKEVVRIVVPRQGAGEKSDRVTNQEFGRWMRVRARKAKKQFLFFNASCWSVDKGQNEIPEAHTRYLAEILTETITDYFYNRKDNAMRIAITGIRKGKSYAQIREDLRADKDYVAGTADKIIFPDQKDYVERVMHHFSPLAIRIAMHDEQGRRYRGQDLTPPCHRVKEI